MDEESERKATSIERLQDELVLEILSRLGRSKDVFRCKAVCKRWLRVVSNDFFIHRFISQHTGKYGSSRYGHGASSRTCSSVVLILTPRSEDYRKGLFITPRHSKFSPPPPPPPSNTRDMLNNISSKSKKKSKRKVFSKIFGEDEDIGLLAAYNDLLLCYATSFSSRGYERSDVYICNPQTKDWLVLPRPPVSESNWVVAGLLCTSLINASYRYCVVCLFDRSLEVKHDQPRKRKRSSGRYSYNAQMFDSEYRRWHMVNLVWSSSSFYPYWDGECGSLVYDGMLWFYDQRPSDGGGMIAFDPFQDDIANNKIIRCQTIDWPSDCRQPEPSYDYNYYHDFVNVGVCQGGLRICQVRDDNASVLIWELNKSYQWCFQHKISLTENEFLARNIVDGFEVVVLGYHPFQDDGFYIYLEISGVFFYNLKTKRLDSVCVAPGNLAQDVDGYFSFKNLWLLKQWWPTPLLRR